MRSQALKLGLSAAASAASLWIIYLAAAADHALLAGSPAGRPGYRLTSVAASPPEALAFLAAEALAKGELPSAAKLSRAAIEKSPLDARAITILGLTWDGQKKEADAVAAMALAGGLGWRNQAAQLWILNKAAQQGDIRVALIRADALLRQRVYVDPLIFFLRGAASDPVAQRVLVERLVAEPWWRERLLEDLRDLTPANAPSHQQLLLALAKSPRPPLDREVGAYLHRLIEQKQYAQAASARLLLEGANRKKLLADAEFEEFANNRENHSPFSWTLGHVPGAYLTMHAADEGSDGGAIRVEASGSAAGTLLTQMLSLPPGQYNFSVRARELTPSSLPSLEWDLNCFGESGQIRTVRMAPSALENGWTELRLLFRVPREPCSTQRLQLHVRHASSRPLEVVLSRPDLVRLGSTP